MQILQSRVQALWKKASGEVSMTVFGDTRSIAGLSDECLSVRSVSKPQSTPRKGSCSEQVAVRLCRVAAYRRWSGKVDL